MLQKYLMQFVDEYDFTKRKQLKIVTAEKGLTFRQLQAEFDPGYHYDNLRFYLVGDQVG